VKRIVIAVCTPAVLKDCKLATVPLDILRRAILAPRFGFVMQEHGMGNIDVPEARTLQFEAEINIVKCYRQALLVEASHRHVFLLVYQ